MLQESDLDTFLELFQRVSNEQSSLPAIHPTDALRADDVKYHRLQPGDLTAFSHSLKIACGAGDASENMFYVFDKIARSLDEQQQYVDLRRLDAWECAIRWAHVEVATSGPEVPELHDSDRRLQVGMACRRLRDRGYGVPIGAFGPSLATGVRQQIVDKVCSLVSRIGGFQIASHLCAVARRQGRIHDGFWTFGTPVTMSLREVVTPALPIGWLFSLAIRHFHVPLLRSIPQPTGTVYRISPPISPLVSIVNDTACSKQPTCIRMNSSTHCRSSSSGERFSHYPRSPR